MRSYYVTTNLMKTMDEFVTRTELLHQLEGVKGKAIDKLFDIINNKMSDDTIIGTSDYLGFIKFGFKLEDDDSEYILIIQKDLEYSNKNFVHQLHSLSLSGYNIDTYIDSKLGLPYESINNIANEMINNITYKEMDHLEITTEYFVDDFEFGPIITLIERISNFKNINKGDK